MPSLPRLGPSSRPPSPTKPGAGNPPGHPPGHPPGNPPGHPPGNRSGSQPGTHRGPTGTQPGTELVPGPTGTQPGTQPVPGPTGTQPGTQPVHGPTGTQPGTQPVQGRTGTQPGAQQVVGPTGTQPGTQPPTSPTRTQPGARAPGPSRTQPGTQSAGPTGTQIATYPEPPESSISGIVTRQPGVTQVAPVPDGDQVPDSLALRGWQSISGITDPGHLDPDLEIDTEAEAEPDTGSFSQAGGSALEVDYPGEFQPGEFQPGEFQPDEATADDRELDADPGDSGLDVDIGNDIGADGEESVDPDVGSEPDDELEEDERATATPTSFDRFSGATTDRARVPGESDEVIIHMTQHGAAPPGQARDSSDDGTRVEANPSGSDSDPGPPSHSGSGSLSPRRDALFGQVLADRYRVLDLIGKGGMGKVYLAEHIALGKRVAVKVLNPAYTHRPDQVKRFLREARAASKIGHENVIDVIDYGEMPSGSVFFVMEHLQGEDLGKLLRRTGSLPWSRARRILLQICRAVQAAHAKGILHRDMKPENCFIIHRNGMRDFVKVLDFGIAKMHEENNRVSHTLTQAGALIGTPEYMAPEQVQGEAGDARIDIYALGCIMYQLLTGQLPFSDKTMFGVLSQQVNVRPVPPRQLCPDADIPVEVEAIILKAMEKDRNLRFQTMAELIEGIVAAPRGLSDGRAGTTSNLDAAASAARIAAAMNAASAQALAAANSSTNTPADVSFATSPTGPISTSNAANQLGSQTSPSAGQWPGVRDPQLLTKLVIGLLAAVLVLVIGLVCALNRGTGETGDATAAAVDRADTAEPTKAVTPPVTPPTPDPVPTPVPDPGGDIIVDDDPEVKKDPTPVKDPTPKVKKDPGPKKDPTPKKDPKVETLPAPTLEKLDPFDQRRELTSINKDVESCRASGGAARGSVAFVKMKVEGATGRVLEASAAAENTAAENTAAARCIAKVVKSKVKFPRFKQKAQEFIYRFPM